MATTSAESPLFNFTYPPLGWHRQHTRWQIRPLGHLSNAEQPASIQTKPLRQAAQLVGLPAELGDGSGFSNFANTTDATNSMFSELQSKFQQVSPTPQPDIQPLWQKAADLSQSFSQIAQPTEPPLDNKDAITDPISETTATPTIDRSTDAKAKDTSSDPLPTVNPLQRQPLGQHQPLGFNQSVITDTSTDIAPPIQPRSVVTSPEPNSPIVQQSQSPENVTFSIAPKREVTSAPLNRTERPSADAVADISVDTEALENPTVSLASETTTPIQRFPSIPSSEFEFSENQQTTTTPENAPSLDLEPEQERPSVADIPTPDAPTTDIIETVVPIQRTPAVAPDIDTSTEQLKNQTNQINDAPPIEVSPELSQQNDASDIVQESSPIETTDVNSNAIPQTIEQSQSSLQQSFVEQSEPNSILESSTADIISPEVSPPTQLATEELSIVIQPAFENSLDPQSFPETPELEPGFVPSESEANDSPEIVQLRPESADNDGVDVIQPNIEEFSEVQPTPEQSEASHRTPENIALPLFEDKSVPVDTAQMMPEISTQEISPVNATDNDKTAKLTDTQAQPIVIPETPPSSPKPIETFQSLESVQPDLLQEPTISESSAASEQGIQQRQIEAFPTDDELSESEVNSFSSEQSSLDTRLELERTPPASSPEKSQIISPDETPSFHTEANLQAQLQPLPETFIPSDDRSSRIESDPSEIQDVSPQSSSQLPADLPPIQAKLPSAPAIQPLGMHELMIESLKDRPDPLPEIASPEVMDLPSIQRKQPQEQKTGLLSPKLAALTSKYSSDEPDDNFWSSNPLTSSGMTSLLDLETPEIETNRMETDPLGDQSQTVSLSVPETTIAEMVEGVKSAHVSSGEGEDQALWQLAHILYSELRNDRGVRTQLASSTFQRASPGLMPIQSEQNKQPHLPLALWPPPMHQLASSIRLQLQTRLCQDFERSARLSKFV